MRMRQYTLEMIAGAGIALFAVADIITAQVTGTHIYEYMPGINDLLQYMVNLGRNKDVTTYLTDTFLLLGGTKLATDGYVRKTDEIIKSWNRPAPYETLARQFNSSNSQRTQ